MSTVADGASKSAHLRDWITIGLTFLSVVIALAAWLSPVKNGIDLHFPTFSWMVATVQIPWLAIVLAGAAVGAGAYTLGRRRSSANLAAIPDPNADNTEGTIPNAPLRAPPPPVVAVKPYRPDRASEAVLQALRWHDPRANERDVMAFVRKKDPVITIRETEIALEELRQKEWIERTSIRNRNLGRMQYDSFLQLSALGMRYAQAQGFEVSPR